MTPKIVEKKSWHRMTVRLACTNNALYTRGDNREYENMLQMVKNSEPTTENIYIVAKDICEHSEDQTISNVMYILANRVVVTTYEIDGEDE